MRISIPALASKMMSIGGFRERFLRKPPLLVPSPKNSFTRPFITIAREPGSGGKVIGKMLAKRIGYDFYDHELIEEIAKSTQIKANILDGVDERGRSDIQDFVQGLLNPDYVSDITYFTQLCKVVLSLAYKGKVVILGRGANLITPFSAGLHVRVTAPLSTRVERAIKFEEISRARAKQVVKNVEQDRRDFVAQYFGKDISNADDYDLTINTDCLKPDDAVDIILKTFNKKFPRSVLK